MGEALQERAERTDDSLTTAEPAGMTAGATGSAVIAETARLVGQYRLGVLAAAFGGGMLVGWLLARDLKTRRSARSEERQREASEQRAFRRAISRWEGEGGALLLTTKGINK